MEQQSVIRTACKYSFHANILATVVTQLRRKMSFLVKKKTVKEKLDIINAGTALLFEICCCYHSVPLHSFFASVCTTLYYSLECEHLIQYFHKWH